jgi:hypothetical protein
MKKLAVFLLVSVICSMALVLALGEGKVGFLADAKCLSKMDGDEAKAAQHKVSCALGCKDGGFGMIAEGKFYKFDEAGNEKALAVLEATDKENALRVRVKGHFQGDLVHVSSIEEVE